jgi:hypothetical protein
MKGDKAFAKIPLTEKCWMLVYIVVSLGNRRSNKCQKDHLIPIYCFDSLGYLRFSTWFWGQMYM